MEKINLTMLNKLERDFENEIELTEKAQFPTKWEKFMIYKIYNTMRATTQSHIYALFALYSYGKEKGIESQKDIDNHNTLAMFYNVKSFLSKVDKENQTFKNFEKYYSDIKEELNHE